MSAADYHGTLEGVTLTGSGRYRPMPAVALGSVPGVGLVTAASRAELEAGRWLGPLDHPHVLVSRVWYRRKRAGYPNTRWFHDTAGTSVAVVEGRVSFMPAGEVAHVCPRLVGQFICGG